MFSVRMISACLIVAVGSVPTSAQDSARESQIESVREAATAYLKALEEGDRVALLDAWTPEGSYVDAAGRAQQARTLIEAEFAEGAAPQRRIGSLADETFRLVTPDVVIQDGITLHLAAPGQPTPKSRHTAVWVQRDGRWLLDSVRESVIPLPPRNSRLAELDWLLGNFAGLTDEGSYLVITSALSDDGNFILREFVIRSPNASRHTISQRIGWDPITNGFRSWTFDSEGGYGVGTWKRQADCWIVSNSGVTSEGQRSAATALYTSITEEGFLLEIEGAMLDNESQPDLKVKVERHDR